MPSGVGDSYEQEGERGKRHLVASAYPLSIPPASRISVKQKLTILPILIYLTRGCLLSSYYVPGPVVGAVFTQVKEPAL